MAQNNAPLKVFPERRTDRRRKAGASQRTQVRGQGVAAATSNFACTCWKRQRYKSKPNLLGVGDGLSPKWNQRRQIKIFCYASSLIHFWWDTTSGRRMDSRGELGPASYEQTFGAAHLQRPSPRIPPSLIHQGPSPSGLQPPIWNLVGHRHILWHSFWVGFWNVLHAPP